MSETPPTSGSPAWHRDPSGRHQLRWWDGNAFTDQVADGGVTSTDPGTGPAPPTAPSNLALPADASGRRASKLPIILAAVGAFVVVLGLLAVLAGDDDGDGTGSFEGAVTEDEDGRHDVAVSGGTVVVVEVEPSSDFDVVVGFELSDDDADLVVDLYEGTGLEEASQSSLDDLVFRRDVGFEGDEEVTFLAVPFGVDATVVLTGFDDSEGDYDVTIESFDLDVDDDADGDELLDAVLEVDDVPNEIREAIESSLED
jgi:hypothetical protein